MPARIDANSFSIRHAFLTRSALAKVFQDRFREKSPPLDCVDGRPVRECEVTNKRDVTIASMLFNIIGFALFVADVASDSIVAKQHYDNGDNTWFLLTCAFIIFPSVIMQIFSCKWYQDDGDKPLPLYYYLVHVFHLGTVQRFIRGIWFGLRARQKSATVEDYKSYIAKWRDITLLQLFEGFLESAPQVILQLYILMTKGEFTMEHNWQIAASMVISIISLSWGMLSYWRMVRLCTCRKDPPIAIYGIEILYRCLIIGSRVAALALFSSSYKYYVFVVVFCHVAVMFGWLCCLDTVSQEKAEDFDDPFYEKMFDLVVSIICLFCFLNIHSSEMKAQMSVYYSVTFVETSVLMVVWFPFRTFDGDLMYTAIGVVFGGFVLGVVLMLICHRFYESSKDASDKETIIL